MKFIDSPRCFTSTTIYDKNNIKISRIFGEPYRYVVRITDLEYFVFSDVEKTYHALIDFVIRRNPISSVEFIEYVISYAQNQGEAKGRRELQSEIRKVLNY